MVVELPALPPQKPEPYKMPPRTENSSGVGYGTGYRIIRKKKSQIRLNLVKKSMIYYHVIHRYVEKNTKCKKVIEAGK